MALLLETTLGDLVIDLDIEGSPALCKNVLKLAKARYYTGNLVYNVQPNRFCQVGDPCGDGSGGACIYGLLDAHEEFRKQKNEKQPQHPNVLASQRRFLKSDKGRALNEDECRQKGRVVATEMNGISDTIGSQLLITIDEGTDCALDGFRNKNNESSNNSEGGKPLTGDGLAPQKFRSVGKVAEDDNGVLESLNKAYCDSNGRPYADVRVIRALVIEDPFDDPEGMDQLLKDRGVFLAPVGESGGNSERAKDESMPRHRVSASPDYERPPEEKVEIRISAADIDEENASDVDGKKMRLLEEERLKREDKSRAVVLEMLGDLPSADITAPENVLFVCKLNPVTEDEDLELIFSRFDEKVSVEIVRDHKTGASLQYAFVEFTTKEQATEAYFKMNNALVDDRRIKVDFSQSVSKVWDRFNQRNRKQSSGNYSMPKDPFREQQQQPPSHRSHSRHDRGRNKGAGSDKRWKESKNSNYSPHHNDRYNDRRNRQHNSSSRDHERHRAGNDGNRPLDSYYDDRHHSHRDRYSRDRRDYDSNHERRHHGGRDRDGSRFRSRNNDDDSYEYSRSRDESRHRRDRRRDEPSTHRSEKKPGHANIGFDDFSSSDRSETSHHKRNRRRHDDRRRRSRSRSSGRSDSDSYTERRDRRRSERKKDRKKRDRIRRDEKRHHKRSRRDSKHHHHHRKDRHEGRDKGPHRDS